MPMFKFTSEAGFLLLFVVLMTLPRALQRWRVPTPISCFALGMLAATLPLPLPDAALLGMLATFGISSLFLAAGLEIEAADLRRGAWPLLGNLAARVLTLALLSAAAARYLDVPWRVALLLALAVLTPSTGFILNTMPSLRLDAQEIFWVKIKAIGGEILALAALFAVLQSGSVVHLAYSLAALLALVSVLRLGFIWLGRHVVPYAPGSEFSLLLTFGVVAAYLTYQLGVYYLVGAFVAGALAKSLGERLPTLASKANLHAIELFASFFVPFYFFNRGIVTPHQAFGFQALGLGLALSAVLLPLRIAIVWAQRRWIQGEDRATSLRVAAALTPTLVFTLVIASLLRERYGIAQSWYGALLVYAGISTLVPAWLVARR